MALRCYTSARLGLYFCLLAKEEGGDSADRPSCPDTSPNSTL